MFVKGTAINFTVTVKESLGDVQIKPIIIDPTGTYSSTTAFSVTSTNRTGAVSVTPNETGLYKILLNKDDNTDVSNATLLGQYYFNVVDSDNSGDIRI